MNGSIEDVMKNPINAAIIMTLYNLSKEERVNSPYGIHYPRYSVPVISEGIKDYTDDEIQTRLLKLTKNEMGSVVIGPIPFGEHTDKFKLSEDTINFIEESKIVIKL